MVESRLAPFYDISWYPLSMTFNRFARVDRLQGPCRLVIGSGYRLEDAILVCMCVCLGLIRRIRISQY